jgi:very-short-patch-repair endonuclease
VRGAKFPYVGPLTLGMREAEGPEAQWGVISGARLRAAGIDKSAITRRLRAGTLHRMYRNVYAVAPPSVLRPEGRWLGAVLACGEGAVLSHRSAAVLWGLLEERWGFVDVTTPARGRKGTEGIRLHRTRRLDPTDVVVVREIPVTTVERTLMDLADVVSRRVLRRAARQAEVLRLPVGSPREKAHGRRGAPSLAALSLHRVGVAFTRSELEDRMLRLGRRFGVPRPEVNERIEGKERDFVWRDARLVVEADSHQFHRTRTAFEDDRRRDLALVRAGWRVVRFTHAQIAYEPAEVASAILDLLDVGPQSPAAPMNSESARTRPPRT